MLAPSLDFSHDTRVSGQRLLFGESPVIQDSDERDDVSSAFADHGFVLLRGIHDVAEARSAVERLIARIDVDRVPLYGRFRGRVQLAKLDLIPVCLDIVPRTFQALHFDMGQPLLAGSVQAMYLVLALYRPPDAEPSTAETRVVYLPRLCAQRRFGDRRTVAGRIVEYVRRYGDGWRKPRAVNTLRLSCFARYLDAVSGRCVLKDCVDYTTGQWFSEGGRDGEVVEREYFRACGFNLEPVEERIRVGPGELLIVDNLRCVHGRVGPRRPRELHQFLYGVRRAGPSMINAFREWIVSQMSRKGKRLQVSFFAC